MLRFWRGNRFVILAFGLFLGLAVYFAIGAIRHAREWDVARDQPIEAWMTPRYIAHSWDVPRDVMMDTLHLVRIPGGPQPLAKIAEERGIPVERLIDDLEAAIAEFRARER